MIKAVFFDVDGTLLSHTIKRIPQDTVNALHELKERGVKIFLATGRHSTELRELPVNVADFDGYVTLNGQLCLDETGKIAHGDPFGEPVVQKLVSVFREKKYPLAFVEAKRFYINYVDDVVREAQRSISTPVPETGTYEGGEIYQAIVFLTREEEEGFRSQLPEGCRFTRWCDGGVDIISDQGGKTEGIKYFCDQYDISREEIMAFGDAENDIDMLRYAGIGVAMGNAEDTVRKCADYVTDSVDDGGIRNALKHFQVLN